MKSLRRLRRVEPGADIVTRFTPQETPGLQNTPPVLIQEAYTRLDGPRDVPDHTRLWLHRWGSPKKVTDALGRKPATRGAPARK